MPNLAPYLFLRQSQSAEEIALDSWDEAGGAGAAEDWFVAAQEQGWSELVQPRSIVECLRTGAVAMLVVPSDEWSELTAGLPQRYGPPESPAWIEAREWEDGWLVYPNGRSPYVNIGLLTLIRDGKSSALITSVFAFLRDRRSFSAIGTDGQRACKFRLTWPGGRRRVECARGGCRGRCTPRHGTSPAGFPTLDCMCY